MPPRLEVATVELSRAKSIMLTLSEGGGMCSDVCQASAGAGQASNAGQLPPDSSDDEEEEGAAQPEAAPQKVVVFGAGV